MKTELDEQGVLSIQPETPTEAFALKMWLERAWVMQEDKFRAESGHFRGSMLLVCRAVCKV